MEPIKLLDYANRFGEFIKVKIENMNEQAINNEVNPKNSKQNIKTINQPIKIGIISCNSGQGIINDVKNYGANFIIEGGQTMNPSAKDFIMAIKALQTKEIIIFPNNSNVILAAKQAAKATSNKNVIVLNTKNQMQGIIGMIQYNNEAPIKENIVEITEAINDSKTILISKAIRTTKINKVKVKEGDYIGIIDGKVVSSNRVWTKLAISLIKKHLEKMHEIITIYVGKDVPLGDAKSIATIVEAECDIEVIVKNGDQPVYELLIGIE